MYLYQLLFVYKVSCLFIIFFVKKIVAAADFDLFAAMCFILQPCSVLIHNIHIMLGKNIFQKNTYFLHSSSYPYFGDFLLKKLTFWSECVLRIFKKLRFADLPWNMIALIKMCLDLVASWNLPNFFTKMKLGFFHLLIFYSQEGCKIILFSDTKFIVRIQMKKP